jgi:hypothetical protein
MSKPAENPKKKQTEIARHLGMTYQSYQKLEPPKKTNPSVPNAAKFGFLAPLPAVLSKSSTRSRPPV